MSKLYYIGVPQVFHYRNNNNAIDILEEKRIFNPIKID